MKLRYCLIFCVALSLISAAYAARPHGSNINQFQTKTASVDQNKDNNLININQADEKTLSTIKGIGQKRAKDIINYRTAHGDFKSVQDLANVKGIGEKRLKKMEQNLTI